MDKLTYSANLANLSSLEGHAYHRFEKFDICDVSKMRALMFDFCPDAVMHLAAESHVDRSIDCPAEFVHSNIVGTYNLLEIAREYYCASDCDNFRFLHVSTDEVYGSLGQDGLFTESSPYRPNSPYSASKAASDHLARAWYETYGLPVVVTNCSNNYGPYQFPEKLIPLTILCAFNGDSVPIYGDGRQVRDWLYVDDHVRGLVTVLLRGSPGRTYNLGARCERTNLEIVQTVLKTVARKLDLSERDITGLVEFVKDRPGHDRRYAIDSTRIQEELGWQAETDFGTGINKTVDWYCENVQWCEQASQIYGGARLGTTRIS